MFDQPDAPSTIEIARAKKESAEKAKYKERLERISTRLLAGIYSNSTYSPRHDDGYKSSYLDFAVSRAKDLITIIDEECS